MRKQIIYYKQVFMVNKDCHLTQWLLLLWVWAMLSFSCKMSCLVFSPLKKYHLHYF